MIGRKIAVLVLGAGLMGGWAVAGRARPKDELSSILARGAKVEKAAGDFKFTEGPVWMPAGFLLFSDIPNDALVKYAPSGAAKTWRTPSGHANGNTIDAEGRLISAEHDRRVTRTEKNGKVTVLADRYMGARLNSPNDPVVKSDGAIYFTDPPYGIKSEEEELGFSGVYRLDKGGKLTLLLKDAPRPNGLAFSPDEKRLYLADSQEMHMRVFDVQADGTLANGRLFADMRAPGVEGAPDGLKVDVKGNVYCTGPGAVWVYAPSGKLLGKIVTPEPPANCAFGDKDFKTLYITARTSLYRVRLQNAGIRPGAKTAK